MNKHVINDGIMIGGEKSCNGIREQDAMKVPVGGEALGNCDNKNPTKKPLEQKHILITYVRLESPSQQVLSS